MEQAHEQGIYIYNKNVCLSLLPHSDLEFTMPQLSVQFWWTYNMGELLWKTQSKYKVKMLYP